MEGRRVLRSLTLKNILSFGPQGQTLELQPLNVLIGPNGSGKTNLIEVLGLLSTLPSDFPGSVLKRGGVSDWVWKGLHDPLLVADLTSTWELRWGEENHTVSHQFSFGERNHRLRLMREKVTEISREPELAHYDIHHYDEDSNSHVRIAYDLKEGTRRELASSHKSNDHSVLSLLRDEERYPGLFKLIEQYSEIKLYRKWTFGPDSPVRTPKRSDLLPYDFLSEDAGNLALILNGLLVQEPIKATLIDYLKKFYADAADLLVMSAGSLFIELVLEEVGGYDISAARLSDGTLRFLSLLAILCHPDPPPLICIEEPELGLHPDIIPTIARLMIDASQRTQLIVTTHSAELVSALGDVPEAVVVCERGVNGTELKRLEPAQMEVWLKKYSLGDLWLSGEIGGTRW